MYCEVNIGILFICLGDMGIPYAPDGLCQSRLDHVGQGLAVIHEDVGARRLNGAQIGLLTNRPSRISASIDHCDIVSDCKDLMGVGKELA